MPDSLTTTDGCCPRSRWRCFVFVSLVAMTATSGCKGRSIQEDNPVFAAAPPRRSLVNRNADEEERRIVQQSESNRSGIVPTGFTTSSNARLTATTVVAEVNGKPVFVDDVLSGGRTIIENDPRLSDEQRQFYLRSMLKKRTDQYCEDELIMQEVQQRIPADKRELLEKTLDPKFQEWIAAIRKENNFTTDAELNELFAKEGITVEQLRQSFIRTQLVSGFLASLDKTPEVVDREDLVQYYQDHIAEFTPTEQVRCAELVVRFRDHGGREGAEKVMTNVVTQLKSGRDFGQVAEAFSDKLSREKQGDLGWITRESFEDQELTDMLFEMPVGSVSKVLVREDCFELYRVSDHRKPDSQPFQSVQKKIEESILAERKKNAREQIRKDIRAKGTIVTMFDNDPPEPKASPRMSMQ